MNSEELSYFEERLRRLHRVASERIRNEYQGLLRGIRENDPEEEKTEEKKEQ